MVLTYKFQKQELEDGSTILRPKIMVTLEGSKDKFPLIALLDTGCDTTILSESVATLIGLDQSGRRLKFYAYNESCDAIESQCIITLQGRQQREEVRLQVPVLIALGDQSEEVVLGLAGIFDQFNITFKRKENRITLKKV